MAFTDATETVVTYNLNGSQREFNIPFDYLSRSFVKVTLFGENTDKLLVVGDDYNYLDSRTISTVRAFGGADGWKRLQVRRYTSDDRIVDFKDGSVLKSADLNVAVVQALHIAAEGRDGKFDLMGVNSEGNWDALDRKITRMAPGTEQRDAVNLGQVQDWSQSALNEANRAKAEADKSAKSAAAALVSQNSAKASETAAGNSASAAKTSETNAKTSETNAKTSAAAALVSSTNAKTSETGAANSAQSARADGIRAYNEAERAKGYADGMGNAIDIGKVITRIDPTSKTVYWGGNHTWRNTTGGSWSGHTAVSPNNTVQAWWGSYDDGRVGLGVIRPTGGWVYGWMPTDAGGTFAMREWVNTYVETNSATSNHLRSPKRTGTFVVHDDGGCGMYNQSAGYYTFYVDPNGTLTGAGGNFSVNQSGKVLLKGSDNSATNRPSFVFDSTADRWAIEPDGAGKLHIVHAKTGALYEFTKEGGTQQVASRQWVNQQGFSKSVSLSRCRVVSRHNPIGSDSWGGNPGLNYGVNLAGKMFRYYPPEAPAHLFLSNSEAVLMGFSTSGQGSLVYVGLNIDGTWLKATGYWKHGWNNDSNSRIEIIEFY